MTVIAVNTTIYRSTKSSPTYVVIKKRDSDEIKTIPKYEMKSSRIKSVVGMTEVSKSNCPSNNVPLINVHLCSY